MPIRIQCQRRAGWKAPEGAIYVGRPSFWGNPFRAGIAEKFGVLTAKEAVALFEFWLLHTNSGQFRVACFQEIRGMDLMCWCPLDQPCHADVLLRLAN